MISLKKHIYFSFLVSFALFLGVNNIMAQSSQITFGKNRVQYKKFQWQFYETDNFRIYFYQGGQDIGKYVIQSSEKCLEEVNEILDFKLSEKLNIIVYNDITDMHQTNIGVKKDAELVGGDVNLATNKLFIYFNGEHSDLDRQIKEGITKLHIYSSFNSGGFVEMVQSALLTNLPSWYTEGLVKYVGQNWSTEFENQLRIGILSGRFSNLSKLNNDEMELVGQSLFQFVEEKYGKDAVGNLVYLTRVNRSVEDGFLFVTGKPLNRVLEEWYFNHLEKFKSERKKFEEVNQDEIVSVKNKKSFTKYQSKLSPDGKYLAYTINDIGRWKVLVYNFEDKTTKVIHNGGFRTYSLETDLSNPMLAWEPKGKKLSVVYEKRDDFFINHYLVEEDFKKEDKPAPLNKFQKVFDFSYAEDSRNIVLSAMQKGQIDVFKYYLPSNKVIQITNDYYDDLHASYVEFEGRQGVLFVSNRPNDDLIKGRLDTVLPNGNFDVFFYDLNNPFQKLSQITFTPLANESYPQAFTDSTYTFLSNYSGINSQYVGHLEIKKVEDRIKYVFSTNENFGEIDSVVLDQNIKLQEALPENETLDEIYNQDTVPVYKLRGTNYLQKQYYKDINELSVAPKINQQTEVVSQNNNNIFLLTETDYEYTKSIDTSGYMMKALNKYNKELLREQALKDSLLIKQVEEPKEEKKSKIYQSKFDGWETLSEAHKEALKESKTEIEENTSDEYKLSRTRQYFLKFMTENVSFNLSNSLIVNNYQPFNPGTPVFNQPPLSGMISFGITDLFEDHKLYGGFRLPLDLKGMEVFITYENLKNRWDKSLTYYRKSNKEDVQFEYQGLNQLIPGTLSTITNIVETQLKYPFNQLNSMRLKYGFRNDRFIVKSTDFITLNTPNSSQNWLYNRVEFVHDHTLNVAKNIKYGFRANVFYEIQKEFPTQENEVLGQSVQLPIFNNSYLMLWGFDARHYQKVYKTIIWANRFAYTSSIGTKKMIYYLGGMDGMLSPGFNETTTVNTDNNYAYQALAVNLRGFQQNIRNGNNFAVWNTELRVPIFSAFSKNQLKSNFLQNTQLLAFLDIGTAWEGVSPFGNSNLTQEVRQNATENPTAIARVDIYKQPVVMGFGTGVRTEIMGYFLRADIGWGYDTGTVNKARFQFAIGYDF